MSQLVTVLCAKLITKEQSMSDDTGIAEVTSTEYVADANSNGMATPKFTLTLPDIDDKSSCVAFMDVLRSNQDKHGVLTITKNFTKLLRHQELCDEFWNGVKKGVDVINGIRTPRQYIGSKKRSLRETAHAFYESLPTSALRMQCDLMQVDFDSYDTIESVIEALVQKHVALSVQQ